MKAEDVIKEARESASEWLEMSDNPDLMLSGILAKKVVKLIDYISYLENRIKNANIN